MKGVLLLAAVLVCSVLLTSCGKAGSTTTDVAAAPPSRGVASANQARLEKGGPVHRGGYNGPVKLLPGRVSTDALGMKASFEVFDHWYGEQGPGWLNLGRHLSSGNYEVDTERGGIEVHALDSPLAQTAHWLETLPGIRIHNVSPVRLGMHSGRRYSFHLNHYRTAFGRCCGFAAREHDVILLTVGHRTIVIEKMPNVTALKADDDRAGREAERVIQSFQTTSAAPTCSASDNRNERTIHKGGWDRYCGPGRAVLRVDGKVFRIKHGTCHRTAYSVGFGLLGYGDKFPDGRGMDLHLSRAGDLNGPIGPIRAGRNSVFDGEVQLPGYGSLPHTGRAIVAKHLKGGTFSLGSRANRVTGRFSCG